MMRFKDCYMINLFSFLIFFQEIQKGGHERLDNYTDSQKVKGPRWPLAERLFWR